MTAEQRKALRLRDLRDHVFMKGQIPTKWALAAYVGLAAICMGVTPQLFPGVKAYYILIGAACLLVMINGISFLFRCLNNAPSVMVRY